MRRDDTKRRKRESQKDRDIEREIGIKRTQTGEIERDSLNDTEHPRL